MHNWPKVSGNVNVKSNVNRMTVTLAIQGKSFQKLTHNKGNPLLFAIQYMTDSPYNNCCVYFHSRAMCSEVGFINLSSYPVIDYSWCLVPQVSKGLMLKHQLLLNVSINCIQSGCNLFCI